MRGSVLPVLCVLVVGCGGDDTGELGEGDDVTGEPSATSLATSGEPQREGPEFAGQFVIDTARFPVGERRLVFATSAPEGELLCLYHDPTSSEFELLETVDVPPRQLTIIDHPGAPGQGLRVRRADGTTCPPPNSSGEMIFSAGNGALVLAFDSNISAVTIPDEETSVDLDGRGHGGLANMGSTDATMCVIDDADEASPYSILELDAQDSRSLNDGFVDINPGTEAFVIPGDDSGCLSHTKWLEAEATDWYFTRENGFVTYFVAFDGA